MTLTATQKAELQSAIDLMVKGQAYETPFSEDVIERAARASADIGFLNTGSFYEAVKLNPISTLLKFVLFVGS